MKESFSAWIDGELRSSQTRELLQQVMHDAKLRGDWDFYHLIGDTLRGIEGPNLCARIFAKLDAEPTVFEPHHRSNTETPNWGALQAAASFAALAFISGIWIAWPSLLQDSPQVTAKPTTVINRAVVRAGEYANAYLFAHQRYSPSNAISGVAMYVRTVATPLDQGHP